MKFWCLKIPSVPGSYEERASDYARWHPRIWQAAASSSESPHLEEGRQARGGKRHEDIHSGVFPSHR